jgi:predicted DCC family thiol-disulfide oxidoreductase YuxK
VPIVRVPDGGGQRTAQSVVETPRPLLIYDGECGFCGFWARYWQRLTGDAVRYEPYQQVGGEFPQIAPEDFRRAVQYIAPDGRIAAAAEASFLTLSHAPGKAFWLWLYRHVPGFAWVAERAYAFTAAHRPAGYVVSRLLWGADYSPPRYKRIIWLYLRLLGLIYLAAFASFASQVLGLVGSRGILPLGQYLALIRDQIGPQGYWHMPMLFWVNASDAALLAACWAGIAFSLLLVANRFTRLSLVLLYVLYLSLFYAGQVFMTFQWDLLLLEAGFLAIFFPYGSLAGLWLSRWLLFRFMFLSGVVKVLSQDVNWQGFTALRFHFETQPLPTPLAWYVHWLPRPMLGYASVALFVIELVLPFFIFLPRRLRFIAAWGFILLQTLILVTGNYNFFNLLTLALCLLLFDDQALERSVRIRPMAGTVHGASGIRQAAMALLVIVVLTASSAKMLGVFHDRRPPEWSAGLMQVVQPLRIANSYGVFAVMTTERLEIIVEGSNDGANWREYAFKYKPGELTRRPPWNIPHQPRLDWQMWFAALSTADREPWFVYFLARLLQGSEPVLDLLRDNPFKDIPPRYIRALVYDYRFADPELKRTTGQWWVRQQVGIYFPTVTLSDMERLGIQD